MPQPRDYDDGFSRHQSTIGRTSAPDRRLSLAIPMNERLRVAVGHLKAAVPVREEFRTPLGVRKSPRNEPAVCGVRLMGI
jgi:hypothetical protein